MALAAGHPDLAMGQSWAWAQEQDMQAMNCFLGRQPVLVPSGFRALRKVTEQAPAATLSRPTPGPGWRAHPDSGVWAKALQQEGPHHSASPLATASRTEHCCCCVEGRRGVT